MYFCNVTFDRTKCSFTEGDLINAQTGDVNEMLFFFAMSNFLLLTTRYEQLNTKIDGKSHSVALVIFKRYLDVLRYNSCILTGWVRHIFPNML